MARQPKRTTNVEAITNLMEFSKYGPLAQLFVIDMLGKAAAQVAAADLNEMREEFGPDAFISADAWQAVAIEIKEKLDAHLNKG